MGYSIQYGPIKHKQRSRGMGGWIVLVSVAGLFLSFYFLQLTFPEEIQQIQYSLFPWTQPKVTEAFAQFTQNVINGESIVRAATEFGKVILDAAKP